MSHDIGDLVRLWAIFYNEAGTATDPTAVTCTLAHPDGTVEALTPEAASAGDLTIASAALGVTVEATTGLYKTSFTPDEAGVWRYRWNATGTVEEAQHGWIDVAVDQVGEVPTP